MQAPHSPKRSVALSQAGSAASCHVADICVSFSATHSRSWQTNCWSWANASFPSAIRESALHLKALGDLTGFEFFFDEEGECAESMVWEIAAMACKHFSAAGAYRVPHANVDSYDC